MKSISKTMTYLKKDLENNSEKYLDDGDKD